jgi:MSHA biogenesis protein MshG
MLYQYTGRGVHGEAVVGQIEAGTDQLAAIELGTQGIVPLAILPSTSASTSMSTPADSAGEKRTARVLFPHVSLDELIILCRQLSALSRAGVPIVRALSGLTESNRNALLRDCLRSVQRDLESGLTMSTALQAFPKVFSPLFISMVNVGENTGRMDKAFKRLSEYLEQERDTGKRIQQATRYPSIVLGALAAALMVINIFVIPAFAKVFQQFKADLPLPTQWLIASSNFIVNNGVQLLALAIALSFVYIRFLQSPAGKLWWGKTQLRLPIIGGILERIVLSRFAHCFAMMIEAGVPIVSALNVVSRVLGNEYVGQAVREMNTGIERGDGFTRTAVASGMFTPLVLQMMMVGEESGSLDEMLGEVARFYEEEVDYDLKRIGDAIEPLLLAAMGGMVLILALGVFLPMWDLGSAATGKM